MAKVKDERRAKYGRLTVIDREGSNKDRHVSWLCQCECGENVIVLGKNLRNGDTKSCGCLMREINRKRFLTHGQARSSEYRSWSNMIQRCTNKNNNNYKDYGKRGIKVCKKWLIFENFFADMGKKPKGYTIERIDNNGNYNKENCEWIPRSEQPKNTRKCIPVTVNGIDFPTISMAACHFNIPYSRVRDRLKRGLNIKQALGL